MAWGREVGSKGTEGPAFLVSSLVIKSSSECKAEAHSPAEPSGRMRRGFHGYHSEKENIQIKPESKVHPVLQPKPGMRGQGCRAATHALPAPPTLPVAPTYMEQQGGWWGRAGGRRAAVPSQPTASPLPEEPVTRPPPWEGRRGSGCTLGPEPEPRSDSNPAVGLIA